MTIISLKVSCSLRAHQLCRKEKGNTNAARPSIVSSSSTQNSHTVSPKYVFCRQTLTSQVLLNSSKMCRQKSPIIRSFSDVRIQLATFSS